MRRSYPLITKHKLLAAALLGSALLHTLLLAPIMDWMPPAINSLPVINAQLQTEQPTQQRLQTKSAASTTNAELNKIVTPTQNKTNSANNLKSVTKQPITADSQSMIAGLTISDDELSSDPIERSYQQQILAHLRNKVRAPTDLHGSVRLEIHFQYRQMATQIQVLRPSGNHAVDEWAVRAVMTANPFPPIPPELPAEYVFRPTIQIQP